MQCRDFDEGFNPVPFSSSGILEEWGHSDPPGSIKKAKDLRSTTGIPAHRLAELQAVTDRYPVRISAYYASLIDPQDPNCPIARQCVPTREELEPGGPRFVVDPLHDTGHNPVPRITHRFADRLLLQTTRACPVRCRFCFRKNLTTPEKMKDPEPNGLFAGNFEEALDYIDRQRGVREVILSGGDPLMLESRRLGSLIDRIGWIPHLRRLRLHSRVPVTDPERVTKPILSALANGSLPVRLVTHYNHPTEVTEKSLSACRRIARCGVELWNQNVLLRGVNDRPGVLINLYRGLAAGEIRPYYLHHPDPALGTHHFYLSLRQGLAIYRSVEDRLPQGLCPPYVIDLPGQPSKRPVGEVLASGRKTGTAGRSS